MREKNYVMGKPLMHLLFSFKFGNTSSRRVVNSFGKLVLSCRIFFLSLNSESEDTLKFNQVKLYIVVD